jgi:predicted RNA-binding Zn ribbon-like protein
MSSVSDPSLGLTAATPLLLGDHPALDFLNSVLTPGRETFDFLENGASLSAWLQGSGVLDAATARVVGQWSQAQQDHLAVQARTLREELRRFLLGRGAADAPGLNENDIDFINLYLRNSPLVQSLTIAGEKYEFQLRRDTSNPSGVTAALAALCADLIANQPAEQVRKCENPACTLWFNDNKSGPRRRWCSMAICGNRMKVAAHRARRKDTAAEVPSPDRK